MVRCGVVWHGGLCGGCSVVCGGRCADFGLSELCDDAVRGVLHLDGSLQQVHLAGQRIAILLQLTQLGVRHGEGEKGNEKEGREGRERRVEVGEEKRRVSGR